MNPHIKKQLDRLSSARDDDVATSAVEELVSLGAPAIEPLCGLLSVDALTEKNAKCEPGERLSYATKALRLIGDKAAVDPVLRAYVSIEAATAERPFLARHLKTLLTLSRTLDPARTESLPAEVGALTHAAVRQLLSAP